MSTDLQPIAQTAAAAGLIPRTELAWPERAKALQIVDASTLAIADQERGICRDFIKQIHAEDDPLCKSAWDTWQLACADRAKRLKPFEDSITVYDREMKAFDAREKQRVRDEQRRIEQAKYTETVVEREKVVEHLETTGATVGEVKAAITRPMPLPIGPAEVMQTPAAPAKAKTSRVVEDWKGEITDMWAFLEFAVKNNRRELVALVQPDKTAIGSIARSTKGTMEVPGLRVWDEGKVTTVGGKAGN